MAYLCIDKLLLILNRSEYLYEYIAQKYGKIDVFEEYITYFLNALQKYRYSNGTVSMFTRFIDGTWNNSIFSLFLYSYDLLDKVKCGKKFGNGQIGLVPIMVYIICYY